MEPIMAHELIDLLSRTVSVFGDRPVFVEVMGREYLVNDLSFSANGNSYTLCFNSKEDQDD